MDSPTSATQLLRCICDINEWMSSNRLKLNADKTQFIWLGSPQQLASVGLGKNGPGKNGPGKNGPGKNGPEKTVRGIIGLVVESVKTVRSFR